MSQQQGIPANRIPQGTEAANQLIKGRNTSDLLILFMLPTGFMGLLMYIGLFGFRQLLYAVGIILALNWVIFRIIPAQESILYWLRSIAGYIKQDKIMYKSKSVKSNMDDVEFEADPEATGGRDPTKRRALEKLEATESTTEMIDVKAVHNSTGLVELSDGSYVGGVKVTGMEMMLADQDIKQKAISQYHSFLSSIDFPIQIRATSIPFDLDSSIDLLERRLEDQDITSRPITHRVAQVKLLQMKQEIRAMGMNNRQYHVMVRAKPSDQSIGDSGPFDINFIDADSPIGKFIQGRFSNGLSLGDGNDKLENLTLQRRKAVFNGLSRIRPLDTEQMDAEEMAKYIRNYWTRKPVGKTGWKAATPVTASESQFTAP